jgi:hypothetical protein
MHHLEQARLYALACKCLARVSRRASQARLGDRFDSAAVIVLESAVARQVTSIYDRMYLPQIQW